MPVEHTVRSYDEELRRLANTISQMGGLVENQIAGAIECMVQRDSEAAERVIVADRTIDGIERDVEQSVTQMLALRQPMAGDLRRIVGALRVSSDLERMGDLAKNIAKRTIVLSQVREIPSLWLIPKMADVVQQMVKKVLDAYVNDDVALAEGVWAGDEEVDQIYNSLFRQLITHMFEDPRNITAATHLMFVAKNLERIADHATNMAEVITFQETGERMLGDRPKADDTSAYGGPEEQQDSFVGESI